MDENSNLPEYTVTSLSSGLKRLIEDKFSYVMVSGEISGFKRHSSGHCYFSLKDDKSVIDGVMWKGNAAKLSFPLQDGLAVRGTGKVTTFAGRSKYQIIFDDIKPAGIGALMALLEALKAKLQEEGLFKDSLKKPLPYLPQTIGIITSPTGAVIRDILHRLKDRFFPHVYVFPVAVQGDLSARQVSYALKYFNKCTDTSPVRRPDIIIIARGGGSVEDLWSFNEEIVARSIAASTIPVISAVGHETDFTICDLVADKRAPTPTAAAEMATPVLSELRHTLNSLEGRLFSAFRKNISHKNDRLLLLKHKMPSLEKIIMTQENHLQHRYDQLIFAQKNLIAGFTLFYNKNTSLLRGKLIENIHIQKQKQLENTTTNFNKALRQYVKYQNTHNDQKRSLIAQKYENINQNLSRIFTNKQKHISHLFQLIDNMSYKNVLKRGYAIIHGTNNILTSKKEAEISKIVKISFQDGDLKLKN